MFCRRLAACQAMKARGAKVKKRNSQLTDDGTVGDGAEPGGGEGATRGRDERLDGIGARRTGAARGETGGGIEQNPRIEGKRNLQPVRFHFPRFVPRR